MWRFLVGPFAITLVLASAAACGGRARGDGLDDAPAVIAATGGAGDAIAGGGAGDAVAGGGAGAGEADSNLSNSCPQASNNASCTAKLIDIRFSRDAVAPATGVWVEPLQIPDYVQDFSKDRPLVEPSKWDRSPLPAGACVLRIHGVPSTCLPFTVFTVGTCATLTGPDPMQIIPVNYYEADSCRRGIPPGCPSASVSDSSNGNWWYWVARGEDTDLVVCAPQCGTTFTSTKYACLRVPGVP